MQSSTAPLPLLPPPALTWQTLRALLWEHKRALLLAQPLALAAALADVLLPLLFPILVDELLLKKAGPVVTTLQRLAPAGLETPVFYVTAILFCMLFLRAGSVGLKSLQTRLFTTVSKDVIYRLRSSMLSRLSRISLAEYETLGSGGMASHYVTDLDTIDQFLGPTVNRLLAAVLTLCGIAAVLFWMHWPLALFIVLLNPLLIFLTTVFGRRVKDLKKKENEALAQFQDRLTETLEGIHQIRAGNRESHYLERLAEDARQVRDHAARFKWRSDVANRLSFMLFLFGTDLFRGVALLMVVYSDLTIGEMVAVFSYLWIMMTPVQELLGMQYAYFAANGALSRINRLLRLQEEPRYPHRSNPFAGMPTVGIRVEDVSFAYQNGQNVLNGLSLEISPGERVAVVGASGGGKSTLVQALLGLYQPQSGTICYGGSPMSSIGFDVVRENVAAVLQHPAIFNDSIRSNLTLGRERTDAELWQALEIAQLRDRVEAMENRLDTVIGRQGVRLSGGQRQRLAIARMVLAAPKVIILDEATSAVDVETEERLYLALDDFLRQRTTLVIAHRLNAVRHADRVYVFENGSVSEQGDHEQLLRGGGLYASLFGQRQYAVHPQKLELR